MWFFLNLFLYLLVIIIAENENVANANTETSHFFQIASLNPWVNSQIT